MTATNGHTQARKPRSLIAGIYAPVVTPFDASEELDVQAWHKHVVRIAKAGSHLCVLGTNGEATQLNASERAQAIAEARNACDQAGLPETLIIAGTGAGSTKETVDNCKAAAAAGADAVIVICPGYYASMFDKTGIRDFFNRVIRESPLPVVIYNFPACANGIDLDSDLLTELSQHPNVIGAKLTCGQVAKGGRLAAAIKRRPFHVMTGFADLLLPSMTVGCTGSITGAANIAPRTIVRLHQLISAAFAEDDFAKLREAQQLSELVARTEWAIVKGGVAGTKWLISKEFYQYGIVRSPLQPPTEATTQALEAGVKDLLEYERALESQQAGAQS
ncbi:unnamed protein product [Parajaminaea phylloscopi]